MSLYYQPLPLDQGSDYLSQSWTWFQADGITPQSLVGYSARLMLRVNSGDFPQLSITSAASSNGQVFLGGLPPAFGGPVTLSLPSGVVCFALSQAGLALIQDRSGIYDLFLDSSASPAVSTKFLSGTWTLTPSATR